ARALTDHFRLIAGDYLGQCRFTTGGEVEDAAVARVPEGRVVALDVGVQGVREEGTVQVGEIDGGGGPPERSLVALVVRTNRRVVRMEPSVLARDARDDG